MRQCQDRVFLASLGELTSVLLLSVGGLRACTLDQGEQECASRSGDVLDHVTS